MESETEGHGRCCRRCYPCAVGQRCFYCTFLITFALQARPNGTPFKNQFIEMFQNTRENLKANSSFYEKQEIVGLFQNTTDGLTEDCELCKDYPALKDIATYARQVSSNLTLMEENKNENFITVALEEIVNTIDLFEKVDISICIKDLPGPPTTTTATTATTALATR